MRNIKIRKTEGGELNLQFIGWKDDGRAFYACDDAKRPVLVSLESAYPDDEESGEPFRFPRVVPVSIAPFEIKPTTKRGDRGKSLKKDSGKNVAAVLFRQQWKEAVNEPGLIGWEAIADSYAKDVRYAMDCEGDQRFFLRSINTRDHVTPSEADEFRGLLSSHQKDKETHSQYRIEFCGAHYVITFAGKSFSAPDDAGMRYIVSFIRAAATRKDIKAPRALMAEAWGQVLGQCGPGEDREDSHETEEGAHRSSDQREASRQAKEMREMQRRRAQLEAIDNRPLSPAEQTELNDLVERMGDPGKFQTGLFRLLSIASGKKVAVPDDNRKAQQAMQKAIYRTFENLEKPRRLSAEAQKARNSFVEHIDKRLMEGFMKECFYQMVPGVNWELDC